MAFLLFIALFIVPTVVGQNATEASPGWWYTGPPGVDDPVSGPFEIDLELGLGYEVSGSGAGGTLVTEDVTPGLQLERLLNRIFVYRQIHDRLLLDFDYDASRESEGFFGDENFYALDYIGAPDELISRAGLGNRVVSIPGDRYVDTAAPVGTSVAAVVDSGTGLAGGVLSARAIARLGAAEPVTLNFVGSRRVFEVAVRDIDHVRRRHFFLPDTGIDGSSLAVYVSTNSPADLQLDGRDFNRLQSPDDFTFDPTRSWLHLSAAVIQQALVVTYTSGGIRAGDATLGRNAFINDAGLREDFAEVTHPDQFGESAGTRYLYLNRDGENSYWEHRGVYAVPELRQVSEIDLLTVDLLLTGPAEANANYAGVVTQYIVDAERGLVTFVPEDAVGFYPRPFPGLYPFTHATTPDNPFGPDNTVYGDVAVAEDADSVNTLRIRFSGESDGFIIDELFVRNSVTVTVAGRELEPGEFTIDEATGAVVIKDGIVSPETPVTIGYRRAGDEDTSRQAFAAVSADWKRGGLSVHGMLALDTPLPEPVAPEIGREQPVEALGSAEVNYHLAHADGSQLSLELWGAARVGDPNAHDVALIAGMDDGFDRSLSLDETHWQVASVSELLPSAPTPVVLLNRGELIYENFYNDALIGGGLRTLEWDNSGNEAFSYADKAGPYNSADAVPNGDGPSLILEYRFGDGTDSQYVTVAGMVAGGLDQFDTLEVAYRGDDVTGEAVRLYLEVLRAYGEDIDGDGLLDGEGSIDDPGFVITPIGGARTVIGSGGTGGANGILDSEDLNGNGLLDPAGASGESGAVIPGADGPFVAEILPGETGWHTVRLDLRPLIAAEPELFEDAEAIRLTLTPAATPAAVSSGRIVVNQLVFHSSGMIASNDGRLTLRTLTPQTSPELLDNPLALAAGETYDKLRGTDSYRTNAGISEQVLEISLIPPLAPGERTAVSRSLGGRVDLARYDAIVFYLFVPDVSILPVNLSLDLRFVSMPGAYLAVTIDPSVLDSGWNEVSVETAGDMTTTVNQRRVGALSGGSEYASLSGVTTLELGVSAVGGDLVDPLILWTDDWHARGSRAVFNLSGGVSIEALRAGTVLAFGNVPVLSDPRIAMQYEYDAPGIEEPRDGSSHTARAQAQATLAGVLPLGISGAWSAASPWTGETAYSVATTVGVDTGVAGVPIVEHAFRYASGITPGLILSDLEYLPVEDTTIEASVRLSEESVFRRGWTQSLSAARAVREETERLVAGPAGEGATGSSLATLSDTVTGSLAGGGPAPETWSFAVTGSAARTFAGLSAAGLSSPELAYGGLIGGIFQPAGATLVGAGISSTGQLADFSLRSPPEVPVGVGIEVDEGTTERNFSDDESYRDVTARGSLLLELPVAFGTDQRVRIIPSVRRAVISSIGHAETGYSEWLVLGHSAVPAVALPFTYLMPFSAAGRIRERDVLIGLADQFAHAGAPAVSLLTRMNLETRLNSDLWYLPSVLGIGAEGGTQVQTESISQDRLVSAELSKTHAIATSGQGAGSMVSSSSGSFSRDFLLDTETLALSASFYFAYSSVTGRSWQINQNTSWTRQRQYIGADRLAIFPNDSLAEPAPSFRPDSDRLTNRSAFQYSWRADRAPSAAPSTLARRLGIDGQAQRVTNREQISVQTSIVFADPGTLGTTVQVPVRVTLEHSSEVAQTENLHVRLSLMGQGGLEKHVNAGHVDLVPAFGVGVRLGVTISY